MSFGNIEKELARLALKSSQSRALKWRAYVIAGKYFIKWHKIQSINPFTNINVKEFCPRYISKPKAPKGRTICYSKKLCSPLRCTISCSARFVVEMKEDNDVNYNVAWVSGKCKTRVVLHTIRQGPTTNLTRNSQPHVRLQTVGFFPKSV